MKFKNKRHLVLSLKKKSGVALSDAEVKELLGIEGTEQKADDKKPEDKDKEEAEKKAADEAAKKEEDEKKPVPEKKADESAPTMSIEDLGKAIAQIQENLNMLMEAMATMMDVPAEEAKVDPAKEEEKKEEEVKEDEEEKTSHEDEDADMTEEEMEKELEKTIAELETLEG